MSQQENIPSSPPVAPRDKERRLPTVTPNRFNRFFNPVSARQGLSDSKSARALKALTSETANIRNSAPRFELDKNDHIFERPVKRRKHLSPEIEEHGEFTDVSFQSSPLKSSPYQCRSQSVRRKRPARSLYPKSIVRARHSDRLALSTHDIWRSHTADFCSEPKHRLSFSRVPYCVGSCRTNSLVAIGDEGGQLNIYDSASDRDFQRSLISMHPHNNALMDLSFSPSDRLLATVAGDKLARIIDVESQTVNYTLWTGYAATPKQVTFMPDSESTLATCGRDGTVQIWDIRAPPKLSSMSLRGLALPLDIRGDLVKPTKTYQTAPLNAADINGARRMETVPTHPHMQSVTAVRFLPNQSHLFVTSHATSSRLCVWDIRSRLQPYNASSPVPAIPVSMSAPVPWLSTSRSYGISDMALCPSGSRIYAVCKDSTVHVYSAPHLVLGQTPSSVYRPQHNRSGARPLYRFQHPNLAVDTFYIRANVRKATGDRCELLAIGNSNQAPVLFSTDDRLVRQKVEKAEYAKKTDIFHDEVRQQLAPVISHGTTLTRGHSHEVSGVSWTSEGDLVSTSDDRTVRIWREDAERAEHLRRCGEGGGERWHCGWADMEPVEGDEDIE